MPDIPVKSVGDKPRPTIGSRHRISRISVRLLTRGTLGVLALVTFATAAWAQTAPTITAITPPRQVVTLGQNLTLSVTATGTPTPTCQWKRNGLPISGATNASYTITSAAPVRDNGWYQAVATNSAGSTTSAVVFVNVACATSQVVAWGGDDKGQTDLPAGLTGVVAVSAGFWHGLALKSDGTVVAWGDNYFGETNVPVGLTDVVAIVAANVSSLALKADGTLVSWGALTAPAGLTGVVAIAADYHALALKADGSVVGWGVTNVPNGLSNVVAIAANGGSSLALKSDGTVVAWDSDIYGQADVPAGLTGVAAIANGDRGYALKTDGSVTIWGAGLNVGQTRMPDGQTGVAALSARSTGNLALMSDGTVLAWGAPMVPIGQPNIVQPIGLTNVVQIALGDRFALALRDASAGFLPVFVAQPANATAIFGQSASFSLTATGAATFTYQWQGWQPGTADTAWTNLSDGASYSGATTATLTVNAITAALHGWKFRCVVGNGTASATSAAAILTLNTTAVSTYSFTLVAGGESGVGSADGTGSAARFNRPWATAVDALGNVYVADSFNFIIRKMTPGGVVTTLAGLAGVSGSADGTGSAARFSTLKGVAVDGAGNIYVADYNCTIRKITPAGVVTTLAGLAGASGNVDGTGSAARFNIPNGVTVDRSGNVYVADQLNMTIRKITPDGVVTTLAGLAGTSGAVDGTGNTARFYSPAGVAVDNLENVYVADQGNHTIRKITPTGVVTTVAGLAGTVGSANGLASAARFTLPSGVAVDITGVVYVADSGDSTIRRITADGQVTTLAGLAGMRNYADGLGSAAIFYGPQGVAVDSAGTAVYVADTGNNRIQVFSPQ